MVDITSYNTSYLKINKDNTEIFFLGKSGLSVAGVGGNIVLTTTDNNSYSYSLGEIGLPVNNALDDLVVAVRQYIDNV